MAILSPNMEKKQLLNLIADIKGGKSKALENGYIYIGNKLCTVLVHKAQSEVTSKAIMEAAVYGGNVTGVDINNNESKNAIYATIFGEEGFQKDELIDIRNNLIGPFVSDLYMGGNEDNEDIDIIIKDMSGKDTLIIDKAKLLMEGIEKVISKFSVEE